MYLFHELLSDASWGTRILSLLQIALTIWMAVDAYHRHVEPFWYFVIVLFQPIGPWIYFFAIKLPTMSLRGFQSGGPGRRRKLSIDELSYRVETGAYRCQSTRLGRTPDGQRRARPGHSAPRSDPRL